MADRRYWDANCFIAWLGEEDGRVDECGTILKAAQAGDLQLVTSAFTLTEVLWPKGKAKLSESLRQTVTDFFRNPYIILVQVDRRIATLAQEYVWDFSVRPKDAVHVASAIVAEAPALETYDEELIGLSGRLGGSPVLQVRKPRTPPGYEMKGLFDDF